MSLVETFLWGFSGSIAVEIANIYQVFQDENTQMPSRYKSGLFWCVRLILAIIAGGLAMEYKIDNPILAANIGASTPLILQTLSQGIRPPNYQGLDLDKPVKTQSKTQRGLPLTRDKSKA